MRFEPWNYLTAEQLLAQFLKEVGDALEKDAHGRRKLCGKLRGKRPEALNAFAAYSEALLTTFGAAVGSAGVPLAGVAVPAFGNRLASRLRKSADRAGSVSAKKQRLEEGLLKDINAILEAFAYRREDLGDKRWSGACPTFLNNRFSTIREVRRFTNALKAKLSILPRFCCFEDVVALTVLELKAPKLVDWVRTHKDFLCGMIGSSLYMNDRDPKDNLANLEERFSGIVPSSEAEWAVEAVCRLFSRVANKTGMSHCVSYSRESLNAIWRADSFDLYFHSNMPDGIDVHEVKDALNASEGGVLLESLRRHAEAGCASFLLFGPRRCTSLDSGEVTDFSFDKAGVAKVVEPAKVDGLLAKARADGSFFELPEDCQLTAAAFCVASGDDDEGMASAEDAGKLLKRWRRDSGRRARAGSTAGRPLLALSSCP